MRKDLELGDKYRVDSSGGHRLSIETELKWRQRNDNMRHYMLISVATKPNMTDILDDDIPF